MPRLVPEEPTFTTESEREVWQRLRDGLDDEDVLIANLRLTDTQKDHEADLVVLMPGVGVVVVEVKGGSLWHDGDHWLINRSGQPHAIDPVEQVRSCKYAVRGHVARDTRWQRRNHVAWAHAVVAPYSSFPDDFSVPELPRWALHDRDDQADLVERLRHNARLGSHGKRAPDPHEVDLVVDVLSGPLPTTYDVNAEAEERAARADRLTQEQSAILRVTRLVNRVEVRGGAGSGKTVLALAQARQLSRGGRGLKAQRVALLCYSLGLAEHLRRQVADWHHKDRPAFVGTFHDFGRQWGAPDGDRSDSDFWERRLPALMAELAADLPPGKKYDAVIVDEAQDFADSWWTPVLRALKDDEEGGLHVYSDEHQRIFPRFGRPPVQLVPLVLDHNLRNTRQIHDAFGPLAPTRMYARGGDGPSVRFVDAAPEDAVGAADDAVDDLLEAGWAPHNIALLTTGHRHPVQVELTDFHDQGGYWRRFFDDHDTFYGHVLGCKGLERPAVVLCVNEHQVRERARERLYVGLSRATDELVVVGDRSVVAEMGGPEVAGRLGIR